MVKWTNSGQSAPIYPIRSILSFRRKWDTITIGSTRGGEGRFRHSAAHVPAELQPVRSVLHSNRVRENPLQDRASQGDYESEIEPEMGRTLQQRGAAKNRRHLRVSTAQDRRAADPQYQPY